MRANTLHTKHIKFANYLREGVLGFQVKSLYAILYYSK